MSVKFALGGFKIRPDPTRDLTRPRSNSVVCRPLHICFLRRCLSTKSCRSTPGSRVSYRPRT